MHDTTVYTVCARWAEDGSLAHAGIASVGPLAEHNQLDLRVLHGDGTTPGATQGGEGVQSGGKGPKALHRPLIAIPGHRHPMGVGPHIHPGGMLIELLSRRGARPSGGTLP